MNAGAKQIAAQNRRARHDYIIEDRFEAGIILTGSEVKSLRGGRASIAEAYVSERGGELFLQGAHIPEYAAATHNNHEPRRLRKLLVRRRELAKLVGQVRRQGYTLVPLAIYFNPRGIAKLEVGLARGKRKGDIREDVKARDWERRKSKLLRERG
jgi:SsrA-binding protein